MIDMVKCPLKGSRCRHCSMDQIIDVQRVGVIKTGEYERREIRIKLGERCNNDGTKMVSELTECPEVTALGVPLVPYEVSELDWMKTKTMV